MQTNETKRIPALSVETNESGLTVTFANGQRIILEAEQLTTEIRQTALIHGLKQKLVDAAAISRNPETGLSASLADKIAAVKAVHQRLLSGHWNAERGDGTGSGGLLFRALCRFYPNQTPEAIRAWLEKKSAAEQTALRSNPKIAAIIDAIRAENPKAQEVDSDELLNQLGELSTDA